MGITAKVRQLCLVMALVCFMATPAVAATINATSCSSSAVQSAIDSANTGDTVQIPAGACIWTTTVTIPSSKRITIAGAGMDATVITRAPAGVAINMTTSGSRVSGLGFVAGGMLVDGDDWRVDHTKVTSASAFFDAVFARGDRPGTHPRGVVDHNVFINARVVIIGDAALAAHALWAQPSPLLGSPQRVFVEDNTFVGTLWTHAIDTNYGGSFVFRHNTLTNMYIEAHSLQGGRATRSWEIYNNMLNAPRADLMWAPLFIRGGTGVIYNNSVLGAWGQPALILDNVRSFSSGYDYGVCNGSSPADGNQLSNGWPCRDQIGRGSDTALWTTQRPFPPQSAEPAYFWNNAAPGGGPLAVYIHNNSDPWIVEGRDYHNNVPRPEYTPFTYPHPLVSGTTPGPPAAPTGLNVR
jgi:hypothetical protein